MSERVALAQRTQRELTATTLFLVDDMDNSVRTDYGGLPNSGYVVGMDGRVFHKQPWVDARGLKSPLEALLARRGVAGKKPGGFDADAGRPTDRAKQAKSRSVAEYRDAPVQVPTGARQAIVWTDNLDAARRLARQANVPVLLELYFDGCAFCSQMAQGPLRHARVVELSRKFVCVKVDRELDSGERIAEQLELVGSPAFAIFDSAGEVVLKHQNYAEADFMVDFLTDGLALSH